MSFAATLLKNCLVLAFLSKQFSAVTLSSSSSFSEDLLFFFFQGESRAVIYHRKSNTGGWKKKKKINAFDIEKSTTRTGTYWLLCWQFDTNCHKWVKGKTSLSFQCLPPYKFTNIHLKQIMIIPFFRILQMHLHPSHR